MSDLTEALDYFEQEWQLHGRPYLWNAQRAVESRPVMFDAARRWAALGLRDGTSVNWCQQHRDIVIDDEEGPEVCWFILFAYKGTGADWENPPNHLPCKVVPAVVLKGSG
jgi:hypothetical protein